MIKAAQAQETFPDVGNMRNCDDEISLKTWKIRVGLACGTGTKSSFKTKTVEIRRPTYTGSGNFEVRDEHAQFYIDGEWREIKSYGKSKHYTRISLELADGPRCAKFWFSCK